MRIVVVCGLSDHKLRSKLAPLLALEGVEELAIVRRQPLIEPGVRCFSPPWLIRRIVPLAELYRITVLLWLCVLRPRPDVIVSIYFFPHGLYAGLVGWVTDIRTIHLLIGTDLNRALAHWLPRALIGRACKVGVRGEKAASRLKVLDIPEERIFSPPNVLNIAGYSPGIDVELKYDLIFVGNLVPVKRVDMLLKAVALIRQSLPSVRLAIVGDGPERRALDQLMRRLQIADNVCFAGQKSPDAVAALLTQARLFVMASESEGLPMAMIEALCCGLPVIVPDIGDISMVAEDGQNARLLSPFSPEGLAEAAEGLLRDDAMYQRLRLGALDTRAQIAADNSLAAATAAWRQALVDISEQPLVIY